MPSEREVVVWIGGTSGLAKTYLEEEMVPAAATTNKFFVLAGHEKPYWDIPEQLVVHGVAEYRQLNLFDEESVQKFVEGLRSSNILCPGEGATLIFGVRLSLVWGGDVVLHISSVAVVNHLRPQTEMKEDDPLPPLEEYTGTYDIFKRVSEEIITRECREASAKQATDGSKIHFCHLRLGAIYSNDRTCLQIGGLHMQRYLGVYFPTGMDCNSSRNVACAISLVLNRMVRDPDHVQEVYYYTRNRDTPRCLGEYAKDYRIAHGYHGIWVPMCVVRPFVCCFHSVMGVLGRCIPVAKSLDYLCLVATAEHTFDNSRFRTDFPEIAQQEETMVEAFKRIRRAQLRETQKQK